MVRRRVRIKYYNNGSGKLTAQVTLPKVDTEPLNFPLWAQLTTISAEEKGGPAWVIEPEAGRGAK